MKIVLRKTATNAYEFTVGDTRVALDGKDLTNLAQEISRVLEPAVAADRALVDFLHRMKRANDVGIEALLRAANRGDILVLLKTAENDQALLDKFHANMSERSRKIFTEDLAFSFKERAPHAQVSAAIGRISQTADRLESEGALVYEAAAEV